MVGDLPVLGIFLSLFYELQFSMGFYPVLILLRLHEKMIDSLALVRKTVEKFNH